MIKIDKLVSNFGDTIGLYFGASVISLFEIIFLYKLIPNIKVSAMTALKSYGYSRYV